MDVEPAGPGPGNPHGNALSARATLLASEKQARDRLNLETARTWRVVDPGGRNALGEPIGYKLLPMNNSVPMASPDAWWRKRAGFVNSHVWVTPFGEAERYAAGDYPNQSRGGDGLGRWTQQDRPLEDTDVAVWYTFGHTHVPRPKDYPVMPAAYIGFLLKPCGFFAKNPANDLPPAPRQAPAGGLPMAKAECCH